MDPDNGIAHALSMATLCTEQSKNVLPDWQLAVNMRKQLNGDLDN